jgi:5-formyltetrahydrofolate cyclo-ligase
MAAASDIRRQMKQRRRALSQAQQRDMADTLCRHLLRSHAYRNAGSLAAYFPFGGEPDLRPLMHRAVEDRKSVFLPVVRDGEQRLHFRPWTPAMPMVKNRYGIPEPADPSGERPPQYLDLVLTPLVAFDPHGNRIGMGAGFYDRSFAFRRQRRRMSVPLLVGTAWSFQQLEVIEAMPWDVPLDAVVTEQGWCSKPSGAVPSEGP